VSGTQQQFWSTVPESDDHRVQVCQRFEGSIEQSSKAHVCNFDTPSLQTLSHHQDVCRFLGIKSRAAQPLQVQLEVWHTTLHGHVFVRRYLAACGTYKISVQHPVGMQVVNAIEYLVQQGFNHCFGDHHRLLVGFGSAVEFDDVL
jgi:hypothetical protein